MIPVTDFTFLASNDGVNPDNENHAETYFLVKYAPSAILGLAQQPADARQLTSVVTAAGVYFCNRLVGTSIKGFDMTTGSQVINGNKGQMLANCVELRGLLDLHS
jgi:hypothetical protein